jgi:hypothetical protein
VKATIGYAAGVRRYDDLTRVSGLADERIARLKAGVQTVEALNKASRGQSTEAALTSLKATNELVDGFATTPSVKKALAPLKTATNLVASAHEFSKSLDKIAEAREIATDATGVASGMEKRIGEAKVALRAQKAAIEKQLPSRPDAG